MPQDERRPPEPAPPARVAFSLYLTLAAALAVCLVLEFSVAYGLLRDHPSHAPGLAQEVYAALVVSFLLLAAQAALVYFALVIPLRDAHQHAAQLAQTLDQHSHRDILTGALNRTAFDNLVVRELESLKRYGVGFCTIMLDVDGFRRVNDVHGYETGDAVLGELAKLLTANMRKADLLFRWRSGRFMVLATGLDEEHGRSFAAKLCAVVAGHGFRQGLRLTVCVGVAQAQPEDTPEHLVARVKAALGQAKEQGEGCVSCAGAAGIPGPPAA